LLDAPSSGGKSIQLLNWAYYAHITQGKNILYFSFEMSLWQCLLRHLSLAYQIPYETLKSLSLDTPELTTLIAKMKGVDGGPYFEYNVNMDDATPECVDSCIRELANTKGKPDLVVCDYIGNMTTRSTRQGAAPWEKNGDAFEKLFFLAKRHNLPILTARQIKKDAIAENRKQKQNGKSAAFHQDSASGDSRMTHLAHLVLAMDPDREKRCTTYYMTKGRDMYIMPFGAHVNPEFNMVIPMSASEQIEWRRLNNLGPDQEHSSTDSKSGASMPKVKQTYEKNNKTVVEWGGSEETFTDDDLVMNWDLELD
jgi:hypothetical protein